MNTWSESSTFRRPLGRTVAALLLGLSAILIVAAVEESDRVGSGGPAAVTPAP